MDHDPWSLLCKRSDNEVREQVQERNKIDIETVAYINNVTVACNLGLFVCIMLFLDVLKEAVILYIICSPASTFIVFRYIDCCCTSVVAL